MLGQAREQHSGMTLFANCLDIFALGKNHISAFT
jgi:hypothetical protein